MKKRRKETKESLRQREQQVIRDQINAPSIVPQSEAVVVTEPKKNHIR
jgi:hypothetical protein